MIEEKTFPHVERGDRSHIFGGQLEIENVDILPHTFDMRGFWDDDDTSLNQPAKSDLCYTFAVFYTDF